MATPKSAQTFSSARSAFGAGACYIRDWLARNDQDMRKRLDRWLESKSLSDFQKVEPIDDHAHARDHTGDLPPLRT